jgi:hypothetical protein
MSSPVSRVEPSVSKSAEGSYIIYNIKKQLGASAVPLTLEERGVLHLSGSDLLNDHADWRNFWLTRNAPNVFSYADIPLINSNMLSPPNGDENYWAQRWRFRMAELTQLQILTIYCSAS